MMICRLKRLHKNVSLVADVQLCVEATCESDMRNSVSRSAWRTASDGAEEGVAAAAGVAAANAGPVANHTPAQKDMPVPSGRLCNWSCCAAIDCLPEGSVDTKTRLCDDLSGKSEDDLYAMFDADFVHVKPLLDNLSADMGREEKRKMAELIVQNADVFSGHEYDLGVTYLALHSIDTGNHSPISEPFRRHPKIYLDVIDDLINRLVDAGICEPCSSPWAANIVLEKKKDSAVPRVTVDFRKLNEVTVKTSFRCLVFLTVSMRSVALSIFRL